MSDNVAKIIKKHTIAGIAGLGILSGSACAPEYAAVVLNVSNIPSSTVRLIVRPVIDGKTLMPEIFEKDIAGLSEAQLGLRLTRNALGSKVTVTVDAQTDQYCTAATGGTTVTIDGIIRYEQMIPLNYTKSESIVNDLIAVHGSAGNDVWVAGANGTTAHWDGCGWKVNPIGSSTGSGPVVSKLYVPPRKSGSGPGDANTAFAVVAPGVVRQWDGTQWQPAVAPPSGKFSAVHGSSHQNVWAVGEGAAGGCILYRYDGSSWVSATYCQGTPGTYMRAVHVLSDTAAYVAGTEGALPVAAKFNSMTNRWDKMIFNPPFSDPMNRATPGNFSAIYASHVAQEANVWVGGEINTLHFNDATGGAGFTAKPEYANAVVAVSGVVDKPSGITAITGTSASDVWIVSVNIAPMGGLPKTFVFHKNGTTWQYINALEKYLIYGMWANTSTDVWFVGPGGLRLRYNGQTFTQVM